MRVLFAWAIPILTVSSAARAQTEASAPASGYDGGFFIGSADDRFALEIGVRVQARFAAASVDPGGGADREGESAFSIRRGRLTLEGHAYSPAIEYKFQTDFGEGDLELVDFFVDFHASEPAVIRVGQFKRPFSRQQITSSGRLELVDRAITHSAFDIGRDIGVMVHNSYEDSPEFEWAAGLFNGTGDAATFSGTVDPMTGEVTGELSNVPEDIQPALVARAGYNHGGIKGYSEADLEGGPLRFAAAGSLLVGFDGDGGDDGRIQGQIDGIAKLQGLSLSAALYLAFAQGGGGFADQSYAAIGGHVQGGYMISEHLQPAVRYAVVAPDDLDATHELAAGFSFYRHEHKLKWQSDIALLGASLTDAVAFRTQLQLSF